MDYRSNKDRTQHRGGESLQFWRMKVRAAAYHKDEEELERIRLLGVMKTTIFSEDKQLGHVEREIGKRCECDICQEKRARRLRANSGKEPGMKIVHENENTGFAQSVYRGVNGRLYCWQVDGWYTWEGTLTATAVAGDCGEFISADVYFFGWDREPVCYSSKDIRLQLQGFPEEIKSSIARATSFTDCGAFEFIEKYTYQEPELVAAVEQIAQKYGTKGIPEHLFNGNFADICRKHGQPWTPRHVEITSRGAARVLVGVNR